MSGLMSGLMRRCRAPAGGDAPHWMSNWGAASRAGGKRLKRLPALLVLALALPLAGGGDAVAAPLKVFACEPEWAALARALGGGNMEIYTATAAAQDPHYIQARPSLIARARRADLLVCAGAELESGWLPLLLRKSGNGRIQAGQPGHFMATTHTDLLEKPATLDRGQGDLHAAGNPHIHLDPRRVEQVARALAATLAAIDPANAPQYRRNLADFTARWQAAREEWRRLAAPLRGKRIVVHHDHWVYLERWAGLQKVATLEPKPGIPPGGGHLASLLERMRQEPADLIVYAEYQDGRAARWLSGKTGIPVLALPATAGEDEDLGQWFERLLRALLDATE